VFSACAPPVYSSSTAAKIHSQRMHPSFYARLQAA
jgi:hypothetical protein